MREFELKTSHIVSFVLGMFAFAVTLSCISDDKPHLVMRCVPGEVVCDVGHTFTSKKECSKFVDEAKKVQPSVVRVCVENYQ